MVKNVKCIQPYELQRTVANRCLQYDVLKKESYFKQLYNTIPSSLWTKYFSTLIHACFFKFSVFLLDDVGKFLEQIFLEMLFTNNCLEKQKKLYLYSLVYSFLEQIKSLDFLAIYVGFYLQLSSFRLSFTQKTLAGIFIFRKCTQYRKY